MGNVIVGYAIIYLLIGGNVKKDIKEKREIFFQNIHI